MHEKSLQLKCIFFLASLTLTYSRHISYYLEGIDRTLLQNEKDDNVCMTPGCIKTAANVLSFLDEEVDPCENFYRFACGGWLKSHEIAEDRTDVSVATELNDDLQLKLKALFDKNLDGTEPPFIIMLKNLYDTCMDLESIETLGAEPLKRDLKTLGGWPVVEGNEWNESRFDWVDTLIAFRKLGYGYKMLIEVSVTVDYQNNTAHILSLDQATLGMPDREYFIHGLNDSATAAHYELGVKESVLLGAEETAAEKELLEALQFEIELAKITVPKEERRDFNRMYNKYTVAQLQDLVPQIPWLRYLSGILNDEISETENVIVAEPLFLKDLASLLERTEKRVVANYMFWRIVDSSTLLLSKEWRDNDREYFSVITGQSKEVPRWQTCSETVSQYLGIALSSYYVRNYFKEESKDAALETVKYIHKGFLNILEDADWMDAVTKREAIAKANSMKTYIGYPKELLNDTAIMESYKNLTISDRSYFKNIMEITKWQTDEIFSHLRKPYIKGNWEAYAEVAVINAYYSPVENSIAFPAGILQNIYFDKDRPNYMNFGGIGSVIGHEITHGFDDMGKQFDKNGNNVNWWDKTTDEQFHTRAQCIIQQYSNYTAENGMKLNGELTQGENIADNGGLKEAYKAYHLWVEDNGQEPLLPSINYSQDQLFWISAAHVWCGKTRPESLELSIFSDPHSPAEFRVIGPMSNLPEFSRDFNCPLDSTMNRRSKCQVW